MSFSAARFLPTSSVWPIVTAWCCAAPGVGMGCVKVAAAAAVNIGPAAAAAETGTVLCFFIYFFKCILSNCLNFVCIKCRVFQKFYGFLVYFHEQIIFFFNFEKKNCPFPICVVFFFAV